MRLSTAQHELRDEVHQLLSDPVVVGEVEQCLPRGRGTPEAFPVKTYRALGERGWLAINWPVDYGGLGRSIVDAAIVAEEMALHGVIDAVRVNSIDNAGETILDVGTPDQKDRFLRPIAKAEMTVTVLYSEPEAGSDLASLRTRGTLRPDGAWVLSGRKVWSAHTPLSDYGICAARTSDEDTRYRGISLFMVRLDQPGVQINPIPGFNVEQLYQVRLDGALVPADDVIGPVGAALPIITRALGLERSGVGFYGRARRWIDWLRRAYISGAYPVGADLPPGLADDLGALTCELEIAREVVWTAVFALASGDDPEPGCAAAKLWSSELAQRAAQLMWRYGGLWENLAFASGQPLAEAAAALLEAPGLTLAAGTSEVMLETIAADLFAGQEAGLR